ncbi:MAG: penicillin-binding transpeptidase domain-containing protein [Bacteriovoracaceae bacterium]|nr:penicillin-binding transpeptidase domain-containing protein [Bacteroidota bacterium]
MQNPFVKRNTSEVQDTPQQKDYRHRLLMVKIVFLILFVSASIRLVQIQLIESGKYQDIAKKQYEARVPLTAQRGNIYDRNGNVLVANSQFVSFAADPKIAGEDARFIAKEFSLVTGKPEREYIAKLHSNKRFVWMERHVRPDIAELIPMKKMGGIVKMNEAMRIYHYDELAGQVLGATNIDNVGVSGIEQQFNEVLRGVDGYVIMQKDGLGRKRPSVDYPREDAVNGHTIELTIDLQYQSIADEELKKGIARTQAEAGLVVMIRPQTGEILAMANYPQVNLNKVQNSDALKNRIISDMYEPGSVFKIVTASAALEHEVTTLEKKFYAENGKYRIEYPGKKIRFINDSHPMREVTFMEAMAYSSNIVMAKVSDLIGAERLYTQARDFGFGMATGIELPAESNGHLRKTSEWSMASLNSISYGYEVGVTPLQIVSAYSAIANDGMLMKPYIVQREKDELGQEVYAGQPQMIRRIIPKQVNDQMKEILEGVVDFGSGSIVKTPGVRIAGKTGTSRKHVNGKYEEGSYNASFVGFFPAEKPEIVCLVMIEKPKTGGYYGAAASAPIFKAIAERIINNNGLIAKTIVVGQPAPTPAGKPQVDATVSIPDVAGNDIEEAGAVLKLSGLASKVIGTGDEVARQYPPAGTKVERGSIVQLMMNETESTPVAGSLKVPEVRGMSVRRAVNKLASEQLSVTIVGSGVVVNQFPSAGTPLKQGTKVTIMCEPRIIVTAQLY